MRLWISIVAALLIQELVTTNSVLLLAYQRGYDFVLITGIFIAASILIIGAGFRTGKWAQQKLSSFAPAAYFERKAKQLEQSLGVNGSRIALVLLGMVNFNHVNAFLASWLSLDFKEVFALLLVGDILWYALSVGLIVGVNTFVNPAYAIYLLLAVSLVLAFALAILQRTVLKRQEMVQVV